MRLLGTNLRKEPFTLDRYNAGDLAGAELLLRGVPGLCLAASTHFRGTATSAESFLHVQQNRTSPGLKRLKASELYAAVEFRKDPLSPTAHDLFCGPRRNADFQEVLIHTWKTSTKQNWGLDCQ